MVLLVVLLVKDGGLDRGDSDDFLSFKFFGDGDGVNGGLSDSSNNDLLVLIQENSGLVGLLSSLLLGVDGDDVLVSLVSFSILVLLLAHNCPDCSLKIW